MGIIRPVGGILGPRPTGASFRTGVWKQQEVFELRQDGVWQTPAYPDLAPYATNASGDILAAVFDPNYIVGGTSDSTYTTSYIKPKKAYPGQDVSLDGTRAAFVVNQAVNSNINWRFTLRYHDQPDGTVGTGLNVFGLTPQANNIKMVSTGNWSDSGWGSGGRGFGFYSNLAAAPTSAWGDYVYRNYSPEIRITSALGKYGTSYPTPIGQSGQIYYRTSTSTSSSRWPFGQASVGMATISGYTWRQSLTEFNSTRFVALWLIPPP